MTKGKRIIMSLLCLIMLMPLCSFGAVAHAEDYNVNDSISMHDFTGDFDSLQPLSFDDATATSYLTEDGVSYKPAKLMDRNLSTTWQEGVEGDGIEESVILSFDEPQMLTAVGIAPCNTDYFEANNRIKVLEFNFAGGYTATVRFPDLNSVFLLELSHPILTDYVQVVIKDVYKGQWHDDSCISEITAFSPAGIAYIDAPLFVPEEFYDAGASSWLESDGIKYYSDCAIDRSFETSWQEGAEGDGSGESFCGYYREPTEIYAVGIHPGFFTCYEANNRPKKARLIFSNGQYVDILIPDKNCELVVRFPEPITTKYVELDIMSVYKGQWHDDCCITEIRGYSVP